MAVQGGFPSARPPRPSQTWAAAVICLATLLCALFVLPGIAGASETTGTVYGFVTGRDGVPMDLTDVWLVPGYGHAITHADGSYTISDVTPGVYRVLTTHWPMWAQWRELETYAPSAATSDTAATYDVVAGEPIRVDVRMRAAALLRGSFQKKTGGPASGLAVSLWRFYPLGGWAYVTDIHTDENGQVWFGVESGQYRLGYAASGPGTDLNMLPGFYEDADKLEDSTIINASEDTTVSIAQTVRVGGQIDVRCRLDGQLQAPGHTDLYKRNETAGTWALLRSSWTGEYRGLFPGTYRVGASGTGPFPMRTLYHPDSITLEGAQDIVVTEAGRYTVVVEARQLESITGFVRSALTGLAIPSAEVTLWSRVDGAWAPIRTVTTTARGFTPEPYDFDGILPGTYRVTSHDPSGIFLDAGYPDGTGVADAADITVGVAERASVEIEMQPNYGLIRGYVRNHDTREPVPNVPLVLWYDGHVTTVTVTSDATGYYELRYMAGMVAMEPQDPTGAYMYFGELPFFWMSLLDTKLEAAGTIDYDVDVEPLARITGYVLDAVTQQPLSGIQVSSAQGGGPNPVTTGFDGRFSLYVDALLFNAQNGPYINLHDPSGRYLETGWHEPVSWGQVITKSVVMTRDSAHIDDSVPPVTTCDARPSYEGTANVALSATDVNGTGVSKTFFVIDRGQTTEGTTAVVPAPGTHTIQYWSVDKSGNSEATKTATFTVNKLRVALGEPVAPSTMYVRRSATISGSYAPLHYGTFDQFKVTLRFYKKNSAGRYTYHHSATPSRYSFYGGRTRYKAIASLPHRGRWRVRAMHGCTTHATTYSSYDYITVR